MRTIKDLGFNDFTEKELNINFNISDNELETLKYCPKILKGNFDCTNNQLKSLKYSPEIIYGNFDCSDNLLTNLKGRPKEIYGVFVCLFNNLQNIKKQIIENQIKAENYITDDGNFTFKEIKKEFENHNNYLLKKEKLKEKLNIKTNKKIINTIFSKIDFGLGI